MPLKEVEGPYQIDERNGAFRITYHGDMLLAVGEPGLARTLKQAMNMAWNAGRIEAMLEGKT